LKQNDDEDDDDVDGILGSSKLQAFTALLLYK